MADKLNPGYGECASSSSPGCALATDVRDIEGDAPIGEHFVVEVELRLEVGELICD